MASRGRCGKLFVAVLSVLWLFGVIFLKQVVQVYGANDHDQRDEKGVHDLCGERGFFEREKVFDQRLDRVVPRKAGHQAERGNDIAERALSDFISQSVQSCFLVLHIFSVPDSLMIFKSCGLGYTGFMDGTLLFGEYFIWHYGKGVRDFFAIWGNMFWFGYHFFSIKLLAQTLFAPYKRFHQQYNWTNLELGTLGQDILLNLFMRMLGTVLRLCVLAAGLIFEIIVCAAGILSFAIWLLLPILVPGMILGGFVLLLA